MDALAANGGDLISYAQVTPLVSGKKMKPRIIDPIRTAELCSRALAAGAVPNGYTLSWNASGTCSNPVQVPFTGSLSDPILWVAVGTRETGPVWEAHRDVLSNRIDRPFLLDIQVRCRKCEECRKARAAMWAIRAQTEVKQSRRTWMMTYTLSPEHRFRVSLLASRKYGDEDFQSCYGIVSPYFTRYLKRVRKDCGQPLRFLLAAEQHKDGALHLHALIHERGGPVPRRVLEGQWPYGFTRAKLCDVRGASYVTKYVAKGMLSRVRASLRYGAALAVVNEFNLFEEKTCRPDLQFNEKELYS